MNGSEKQVKWAMDIVAENKAAVERHLENSRRRAELDGSKNPYWHLANQVAEIVCPRVLETLDGMDSAKSIIDSRDTIRYAALRQVLPALATAEQEIIKKWESQVRKSPSAGNNVYHIMSLMVG